MTDFEKIFQKKYAMSENNPAQRQAIDQIDGPVLVIAGPGTGKTQLLSTRIANILRKTDVGPENILAMTFTESGARNMRERLATMIGDNANKVGIFTYHGFANDIIQNNQQYFIGRNLENQADELIKVEIATQIKNNLPHNSLLSSAEVRNLLKSIGEMKKALITPEKLKKIAKRNIRQQEAFHEDIKGLTVKGSSFKKVEDFYVKIMESLTKHSNDDPIDGKILNNLSIYLAKLVEAFQEAQETGKSNPLTTWKGIFLNKKDSFGNFQISDVVANKTLLEFADFYEKYLQAMKEQKLYDFDDMILEAIYALENNDDFRYTLQEKYQYLLLDEYQDTNDSQAKIIELLTNNPANEGKPNVLAVGDDDQAIMAFQGASKSNMIDFYRRFNPQDIKVINLTKNYRSDKIILESAKNVAESIAGRLTKNLPGEIEKNISAERDFTNENPEISRIRFASQIAEFSWVAEKISQLVKSGVNPSEIAVIAPLHKFLLVFVPYLAKKNIPMNYEKRENILEETIVLQLTKIAKLVLAVRDKNHNLMNELFPEVLSYEFWNIPTIESWKLSWLADDNRKTWIETCLEHPNSEIQFLGEMLITLAESSHTKSFEEMFDLILGSKEFSNGKKSPIRGFLENESAEEFYHTLSVLTVMRDRLREFSHRDKNDLQDLVNFVEAYNNAGVKIINTNPHNLQTDAVSIMTPFSAKGLEFKHVFLISLINNAWNNKARGNKRISMPANLQFTNIEDEGEDTKKRAFFVAITRAKTHLYLTNAENDYAGKKQKSLDFLSEREEDGEIISGILPEDFKKVEINETQIPKIEDLQINWHNYYTPKDIQMKDLLRHRLANFKLSPTNLNAFTDIHYGGPLSFYEKTILRFPEAYGANATLGTLVHDGFNYIQNKVNSGITPKITEIENNIEEKLKRLPLSESEKSEILIRSAEIFRSFFNNKIDELNIGDIAEKNFSNAGVSVGDALLTGKIDLIKINKQEKTITVLDYKTGSIPVDNSKIVSNKTKVHKYEQQLYFYKILLENSPEFAGYKIENGVLEFVEPSSKNNNKTHTHEIYFTKEKEDKLKLLIQAVWEKIQNFDFEFNTESYPTGSKGIREFEDYLIEDFLAKKS